MEAFGQQGLGALTVSGIPGFVEKRKELLKLSHTVAHLKPEELAALENPKSLWNTGAFSASIASIKGNDPRLVAREGEARRRTRLLERIILWKPSLRPC